MNQLRTFCLCAVLSVAPGAMAQTAAKPAPTPAPAPSIGGVIDREISSLEREFVSAAEAMPDDKFNFAPGSLNINGSEYKGVKTFAEEVRHVAATNFLLWAPVTGEKPPIESSEDNGPPQLKTKAEIIKYLKDSFAFGHKAARSLTSESAALALIPNPFGQGQTTKLFVTSFAVGHAFDHYGQMVEYLRMNGIIPPASRGNQ
ncbi:MAG TPA: DinB family protein [Candidatus Angelobacter sp.]|nr:DinB family protein [Candidatus Angelobacter sp.]